MTCAGIRGKSRNIAVLQAGGPTSVFNCSLYGLLKALYRFDDPPRIFGIRNGAEGFAAGDWFVLDKERPIDWLKRLPGAALGSGRKRMTEEELEQGIRRLRQAEIRTVVMMGGNGTMGMISRLADKADEMGFELQVIGIPKTVDNDLFEMDHTPGFPSAAKFVAHAVRDVSTDLAAMKNFEQVRVIETMGRNVGWLTAASSYFKLRPEDPPHLVYVPETTFRMEEMLDEVSEIQKQNGICVVVASEGLKGEDGRPLMMNGIAGGGRAQSKALGGVGHLLAGAIHSNLGLSCRYDNLGILQRCASFLVSDTDRLEAEMLGSRAADLISRGVSGKTVGVRRLSDEPYRWEIVEIDVRAVEGRERPLAHRYAPSAGRIDASYRHWLKPFMGTTEQYRSLLPD